MYVEAAHVTVFILAKKLIFLGATSVIFGILDSLLFSTS